MSHVLGAGAPRLSVVITGSPKTVSHGIRLFINAFSAFVTVPCFGLVIRLALNRPVHLSLHFTTTTDVYWWSIDYDQGSILKHTGSDPISLD